MVVEPDSDVKKKAWRFSELPYRQIAEKCESGEDVASREKHDNRN